MKNDNNNNIGFIAGRGQYPLILCAEARKRGVGKLVIAGFHGHINEDLVNMADFFQASYVGQISKIGRFFKKHNINKVILSGQVKPSNLYKGLRPDWVVLRMLASLKERNAATIFTAVCDYWESFGIKILPASTFMEDYLAPDGVFGDVKMTSDRQKDADYAFKVAKDISYLDIGQTCVVKKGTVLAVEGLDGTDSTIIRGGELGYGGVTVAKVAKKGHDMRFDIPCVGLRTVDSLIKVKAQTFIVESSKTIFLEKDEVLARCKEHNICLIGR